VADSFSFVATYGTSPPTGTTAAASICANLSEALSLTRKDLDTVVLNADAPLSVSFGSGVASAAVVILKATGGKVRARITSADGSQQSIPVDDLLVLIAQSVPITAIDLTRVPGVSTTVDVFLGQTT
jgi:hypothetical protein